MASSIKKCRLTKDTYIAFKLLYNFFCCCISFVIAAELLICQLSEICWLDSKKFFEKLDRMSQRIAMSNIDRTPGQAQPYRLYGRNVKKTAFCFCAISYIFLKYLRMSFDMSQFLTYFMSGTHTPQLACQSVLNVWQKLKPW